MLNYEDFEEKTLQRREIFKGKIIDVFLDDVALPTGGTAKRELVFRSGAVAMIPLTAEGRSAHLHKFNVSVTRIC